MTSESHNLTMGSKFENINTRMNQNQSNLESNITEQVNESIFNVKDSIVTALRDDNKMLQAKVEFLENKLAKVRSPLVDWAHTIEEIILKFKVFLLRYG